MSKKNIRVLLVDDHPLFREGIKAILAREPEIVVVGEAGDGEEAIWKTMELNPDLILLDVTLPKMNGFEAAKILQKDHPDNKILILTMHNRHEYSEGFHKMGVSGYIAKDAPPDELLKALRLVADGHDYFGAELPSARPMGKHDPKLLARLSPREREVLRLLTRVSRNKDIADALGISVRTVEKHRFQIMKKLGIDNVASLTRYALAFEALSPE